MTVNFEWTGMLEWTKVLKRGVIGPCLNHWANGKKHQLRAPERVFLPTIELVVASEGDALFELAQTVCGPSDRVALTSAPLR